MKYVIEYDYRDRIWVARYDEYPSLAAHGDTPDEALRELEAVIDEAEDDA